MPLIRTLLSEILIPDFETVTILAVIIGIQLLRLYYLPNPPEQEQDDNRDTASDSSRNAGSTSNKETQTPKENNNNTTTTKRTQTIPISVNYHFTRVCNASCKFCFHTATTSYRAPISSAKESLRLLKNEGMRKINFAGGEPFLEQRFLGELCRYAKEDCGIESVSIVSNGTKIRESWLRKHAAYIDILAISCDSFNAATNAEIGRMERGSGVPFDNVGKLFKIRDWCRELGIKFKLNTVVCSLNCEEDMVDMVVRLEPFRWKVFQVLVVGGENESEERLRDARGLVVTAERFGAFCEKHRGVRGFTPEANDVMRESYLILDEYLRFLSGTDKNITSKPILEVGVQEALRQVNWDQDNFMARGGLYDWSKGGEKAGCGGGMGIDPRFLEF